MTRKLNTMLLMALLFIGLPFAWLMLDSSTRGEAVKPVTITQLRRLSASMPGDAPVAVRYETIGMRHMLGDLLAAGSGLRPLPFVVRAYELVGRDGSVLTIDRGMSRAAARSHRIHDFDPVAQGLVDQALASSTLNLLLSRHVQHSGRELARSEQVAASSPFKEPYAVAQGVVTIPADTIAPGIQMIYVRLSDGGELLFAGDVAPTHTSWDQQRLPARLVTSMFVDEDREELGSWLRTVQALKASAPSLQIVPGHDSVVPRILIHGFLTDQSERHKRLAPQPLMR